MSEGLPLSVLLLVRDETARVERLLPALAFAREVVVVWDPAGAADTRAAAARHGARVFERALDGFGPQRRFALAQCAEPWVLWIDADETPDARAVESIRRAVTGQGGPGWFAIERHGHFLGRRIRFCGWRGERVVRLFRRAEGHFDDAPVHEQVHVRGPGGRLEGALEHHSYESWDACVDKLTRYAAAGADRAWRAGKRATALDVLLRPPLRFMRMYVLQLGVLDGAYGLLLCLLAGAQVFLKYGELWERGRRASGAGSSS
jgi:hypothetical protein